MNSQNQNLISMQDNLDWSDSDSDLSLDDIDSYELPKLVRQNAIIDPAMIEIGSPEGSDFVIMEELDVEIGDNHYNTQ